ncbi:MAG: hypothetical protein RIQ68_18 [Pseudomonadota bacterium]
MPLSAKDISQLRKLIAIAEKMIAENPAPKRGRPARAAAEGSVRTKRLRRSGKELVAFRKMLLSERKKGTPVAELARKHGISAAYIYQL